MKVVAGKSPLKRFCAKCGTEIGMFEASNLRNLCSNCYMEMYGVLAPPREVSLTLCRKCYSVKFKNRWLPIDLSSEKSVENMVYVIRGMVEKTCDLNVSVKLTHQDVYRIISGEQITITITFDERIHPLLKPRETSMSLDIKPSFSICPVCLRVIGKNFEAIIQLRDFDDKELEQIKALVNKLILEMSGGSHNIQTGAVWEEVDGGVNVLLPSISIARRISNIVRKTFNVQVKESYKDRGWDKSKGKRLRRLTILLRSRNA
ncbi:MAG: NMD3-related protein [Candidatus Nezhaarchaeales archaeon]